MSAKPNEEAFQRHPRPQLPTKAALLFESRKNTNKIRTPSSNATSEPTLHCVSPWTNIHHLGDLEQDSHQWHIGLLKGKLTMLRQMKLDSGRKHLDKVKPLIHPNILKLEDMFEHEDSLYFRFEYSRFTLEEVLNVHIRLEEPHILAIAHSVRLQHASRLCLCWST